MKSGIFNKYLRFILREIRTSLGLTNTLAWAIVILFPHPHYGPTYLPLNSLGLTSHRSFYWKEERITRINTISIILLSTLLSGYSQSYLKSQQPCQAQMTTLQISSGQDWVGEQHSLEHDGRQTKDHIHSSTSQLQSLAKNENRCWVVGIVSCPMVR